MSYIMTSTAYSVFRTTIQSIIDANELSNFKVNDGICGIFEHKNCRWGQKFYDQILAETNVTDEELVEFCKKNDAIGNPQIQEYSFGNVSSNSIKYVYHANITCKHIKSLGLTQVNLVEIGGGYGGMAFAMHHFAHKYGITIESYSLLDFPELCKLQEMYLQKQLSDCSNIYFHSADTFGANIPKNNLYLVAIYSLGELEETLKQKYIETLFPKVDHGFVIWNFPPYLPFYKNENIVPEIPLTGPHNSFIYF